jgi:hypothetical protein
MNAELDIAHSLHAQNHFRGKSRLVETGMERRDGVQGWMYVEMEWMAACLVNAWPLIHFPIMTWLVPTAFNRKKKTKPSILFQHVRQNLKILKRADNVCLRWSPVCFHGDYWDLQYLFCLSCQQHNRMICTAEVTHGREDVRQLHTTALFRPLCSSVYYLALSPAWLDHGHHWYMRYICKAKGKEEQLPIVIKY